MGLGSETDRCKSLSPSFALLTSFNNNNTNNHYSIRLTLGLADQESCYNNVVVPFLGTY